MQTAKSAQVRSREKFFAQEGKNSRYFLDLEKARASAKVMDRLKAENGEILTNQNDILNEQVKFYSNVFSRKGVFDEEQAEDFTRGLNIPQLFVNMLILR